jgi:threonine aldolase
MTTASGQPLSTSASNGTHKQINAWQQPGPAAFDFRSDTMTTPNASMLQAIINTTLMDDVVLEDPTTNALEAHIAQLTGHEAGLLVMSGTMGNQVALRTHLISPPYSVLCDHRSHIVKYEAGGVSMISGAMTLPIHPTNNHHLTLSDIQAHAIISDDVHACPTRVISLENTLNGTINPLSNIRAISTFAREHDIRLHLDGARIWEVASTGQHGTLLDFCSLFDSVSLCFSKGLGAPIGSVIVGSKAFITRARRFRKMFGGGTRQAGVISAAARVAVDENFGLDASGKGGKLAATHKRARAVAEMWARKGGTLTSPTETNMVWPDLAASGVEDEEWVAAGQKHGLKFYPGRIVVHYQIADEALQKLEVVMDEVLAAAKGKGGQRKERKRPYNQYANGQEKADDRDEL